MRQKETHFVNVPPYAQKIMDFIKSILSDKLRKRLHFHKDAEGLRTKVNPKVLPAEYGGEVPLATMIAKNKAKLREKRAQIMALDDLEIEITKSSTNFGGSDDADIDAGIVGSFRKLEVD